MRTTISVRFGLVSEGVLWIVFFFSTGGFFFFCFVFGFGVWGLGLTTSTIKTGYARSFFLFLGGEFPCLNSNYSPLSSHFLILFGGGRGGLVYEMR